MTRKDIFSIVQEIYNGTIDNNIINKLLDKLELALPNSHVSDLIFQDFRGLNPEQVVDEAMQQEADYARKASQGRSD